MTFQDLVDVGVGVGGAAGFGEVGGAAGGEGGEDGWGRVLVSGC